MLTYRKDIGSTDWKENSLLPHERLALKMSQLFSAVCFRSPSTNKCINLPVSNKQQLYRFLSVEVKEIMTYREITSLPPGSVYIDVGANVGLYCSLACLSNPKKIIAFEPLPSNLHSLLQLKTFNNISSMSIYGSPLYSESNSLVPLEIPPQYNAAATGAQLRPFNGSSNSTISLKTITLDEVISIEKLTAVDLIKLDVDGLELSILHGSKDALLSRVYKKIICEVQPDEYKSIKDYIESYGYKMTDQDPTYKSKQIMKLNNLSIFDVPRNLLFQRK